MDTKLYKSNNLIISLGNFLSHLDLDIDITKQCSWIVSKQPNEQRECTQLLLKQKCPKGLCWVQPLALLEIISLSY